MLLKNQFFIAAGIFLTFIAGLFSFSKNADAATPEVIWAEEVLLVSDETNPLLVTGGDAALKGYKQKIAQALTRKLHAARDAGKLPFTLKEDAETYEYAGVFDDVGEPPVALIPLAIISDALRSEYPVKDQIYRKSVVVGSLYLAICKGGSTANNWTMVGGIPISGYVILGDDINNLKTSISKKEEADAYVAAMEKVINEKLDFRDLGRYLKNIKNKKMPDTYEVMEVGLSSKKAGEIFGNRQEKIKALLGSFYTSKFQEKSKAVVYPPIAMTGKNTGGDMSNAGNKSAADEVSDSIYSLTGGKSASGATITLSLPSPDHKIYLDFAGAAWQELKTKKESYIVKNYGYKALLKSRIDNQPEKSADDVKSVQYIIPQSGSVESFHQKQLPDIFTELLIRLTDRLATGKK